MLTKSEDNFIPYEAFPKFLTPQLTNKQITLFIKALGHMFRF